MSDDQHHNDASISADAAQAYLMRDLDQNLALLGTLEYEAVDRLCAAWRHDVPVALAIVTEQAWAGPDRQPMIAVEADDGPAMLSLLGQQSWPGRAIWSTHRPALLPLLEQHLGHRHNYKRGVLYYLTDQAPELVHPGVRMLTLDDADRLDLTGCDLSSIAMRNWLRRGWRLFGAIDGHVLLSHALVAYPIGDTEEVAAVYTAASMRRQGLASVVVAAAIRDILSRGHRAVYACKKTNLASRCVASRLELRPLFETWEIVTGATPPAQSQL